MTTEQTPDGTLDELLDLTPKPLDLSPGAIRRGIEAIKNNLGEKDRPIRVYLTAVQADALARVLNNDH